MAGSMDILQGIVSITADQSKFDKSLADLRAKAEKFGANLGTDADIGTKLIEIHNRALMQETERLFQTHIGGLGGKGWRPNLGAALGGGAAGLASGGSFGMVTGALGGAIGGPAGGAVGTALGAIPKLVEAFNPVAVERFNYILKDVTAVIGDRLQPVLDVLGIAFRTVGDLLENMLPDQAEFAKAMKPLGELVKGLGTVLMPVANIINSVLIVALEALGKAIQAVVDLLPKKSTKEGDLAMIDEYEKLQNKGNLTANEQMRQMDLQHNIAGHMPAFHFGKYSADEFEKMRESARSKDYGNKSSAGKGYHGEAKMQDYRGYYNDMAVKAVASSAGDAGGNSLEDNVKTVADTMQPLFDKISEMADYCKQMADNEVITD